MAYVSYDEHKPGNHVGGAGPGGFSEIAFHPTDSLIAFGPGCCGCFDPPCNSCIHKTTDGGRSWAAVLAADSLGDYGLISFRSAEVNKDQPAIVYAGATRGIYYSTDSGISWRIYNNSFTLDRAIGIHHISGSDTLIVAAGDGVFSVFGGSTWVTEASGTTNDLGGVFFSDSDTGIVVGEGGIIELETAEEYFSLHDFDAKVQYGMGLMDFASAALGRKGSMLELGCGRGEFIFGTQRRGWNARGVEFTEDYAIAARSHGIDVEVSSIERSNALKEQYDLIVLVAFWNMSMTH